jgi:hypothetical protein
MSNDECRKQLQRNAIATVAAALSRRVNAPTERGDYSPSQPKKMPDGD